MALHWDLTKIANRLEKYPPTDDAMNPVTYALIMYTMITGIGELTEKTAEEFYARVCLYEKLVGPMLHGWTGGTEERDFPITPESVRDHIGLSTNVFPMETRAAWVKRTVTTRLNEYTAEYHAATPATVQEPQDA